MIEEGEVVVGVHESGMELEEGHRTGRTFYCSNCKNNIHCYVEVKDKKAEIIKTCSNDACKCKCKTHFACKQCGYLHPYGVKCTNIEVETTTSKESDEVFEKLMDEWREENKQVNVENKK